MRYGLAFERAPAEYVLVSVLETKIEGLPVFRNVESPERIMTHIGQQLNETWRPAYQPVGISPRSLV